jgi:hypothetical protein
VGEASISHQIPTEWVKVFQELVAFAGLAGSVDGAHHKHGDKDQNLDISNFPPDLD